MATGFYWLSFNTLSFDFTDINNRDTFNGFSGSCSGIASAVAPIAGAYIISRFGGDKGYNLVFALTLSIFVILTLISIFLRCKNYGVKLNLRKAFSRNCKEWSIIRKSTALWGFRDVIIIFLVNILIIETTGNELSLGKLALIGSLTSSAAYMLVQKVIKPPQRRISIIIGTVGSLGAVLALVLGISYRTLLIYTVADSFFLPFYLIQLSSSTFNVIDRIHEEDMRIEYMINKDIVLNAGRVISSLILIILLSIFKGPNTLSIYLAFIGLIPIISGYFLGKLKRVLEGKKYEK
jgi:YQGE family putative transporter